MQRATVGIQTGFPGGKWGLMSCNFSLFLQCLMLSCIFHICFRPTVIGMGKQKINTKLWSKKLEQTEYLGVLSVKGRILLEWILRKQVV
jgi:hypothetical protein